MALLGLLCGCKSPQEVEKLSKELPVSVRRKLGIPRRVPDTTLRGFLIKADPVKMHNMLSVAIYDAARRKALSERGELEIPFGVLTADGKYPSISATDDYEYLQVHHDADGQPTHGLVRTITGCLMTAVGRPVVAAIPVPGSTNEKGVFQKAFGEMVRILGRRFRVYMYDAGVPSEDNADAVITAGKDYAFLIADPRWQMYQAIELLFRDKPANYVEEEIVSSTKRIVRKLTVLPVTRTKKDILFWKHTRTMVRIETETHEEGKPVKYYTRYSVSSLEPDDLSLRGWFQMHFYRWDVESVHNILDTTFEEDKRPWIRKNAQGNLVVHILRRVAYTLLTLYKNVTIRNDEERYGTWKDLMESLKETMKWATDEVFANLRPRRFAVPPALV